MMLNKYFFGIFLSVIIFSSCQKKKSLFSSLPSSQTHIDFTNKLAENEHLSILYYLYYYNGGGVSIGDINNDGLPDIYFTANNKGGNKLYLNKGNFVFEDITQSAGVAGTSDWCTGVTMADVNGDGLLDIYVSTVSNRYGLKGHNELYINQGNNKFKESAAEYGLNASCFTTQTVFFDYDHDGDLDCYILNQSHHPHENITDTSNRHTYDSLSGDRLYRNDLNTPAKKFTDVSKQAGIYQSNLGYGLGIAVADFNNDGWEDIYVGNDFHENDYYYLNNHNGTFTESGAKHFGHYSRFSMGNDAADYNNDGQTDIVTVDMLPPDEKILKTYGSDENADIYKVKLEINGYQHQSSKNCLQRNNGNGVSYSETSLISGMAATDWSWCPLFADLDNDGNKDLLITSGIVKRPVDLDYVRFASDLKLKGMDRTTKFDKTAIDAMPSGESHPYLYKGDGQLKFADMSKDWGTGDMKGFYNGAAYADLDNDGNLDIVINAINSPAVILKNNSPKKNYLSINFKGDDMNTFGIGCKAYLFQGKKIQYQQLMATRGFESSSDLKLHFGLGDSAVVDSALIIWPNQKYQVIHKPEINKTIIVSEKNAAGVFDYNAYFPPAKEALEDISANINCKWKHTENDFLDYNVQYLIPHSESTRGPKIAVADVNKDGLDDFYACGAKGQPGAMMIQQPDGTFKQSDTAFFNQFRICEDVDAKFFDANGDGYPDLWVVSGGNEMPANEIASADHLFINDGTGHFIIGKGDVPHLYENKSCIATADIDKDGDMDVFVGFLSDPNKYGIPQSSYLYLNDGKGKFTIADSKIMNLINIGMVTSATFTDINNDGWPDLIVAGEWMPVKVFINNKGKFTEQDIQQSTGLWQSLYATDVNGDGNIDLLAGNWGHNNKFYSGKNGPLKLYVSDFDHNGSLEQIMCYTVDGKEYPFLAKDELERSLPVLKKAYLKYSDVAGKTVDYILYDLFKNYTELKAEVLGSSVFINDGKGNFTRKDLPESLQLAPIFSFTDLTNMNKNGWLACGNFYDVIPYEGRYDAQQPTIFNYNKTDNALHYQSQLAAIKGQARDVKWITVAGGKKIMVMAFNNQPLTFLKPSDEK
ncbi:MAG: VCBS repeat-containing protein [Sphingobacteriales bacterium]|nr:VCBS repeat-containing protein [Sphingobacteriales bacterium]